MEYRVLGRSGLRVSEISLGCSRAGAAAAAEKDRLAVIVLPAFGVGFQCYYIGTFDGCIERIAQVKSQLIAHVHGAKEIRRLFEAITAYFPQKAIIFFGCGPRRADNSTGRWLQFWMCRSPLCQ